MLPTPKATEIEERYNDWKERMVKSGNPKNTGKTTCNIGTMAVSGMLPTPRANKVNACNLNSVNLSKRNHSNLEEVVAGWVVSGMLPTPATRDWKDTMNGKDAPSIGVTRGYSLGQKISSMLPTPTCNDMKNASLPHSQGNRADSIVKQIVSENPQAGETQQLNPAFVGEMMGFPEGWTLQPYINGGREIGEPTDFSTFPNFYPTILKGDIKDMEGITASKWRNESIKAYGNAIVPEVAFNIFKAINEYNSTRTGR